ncbi:hypothetical protein JX265_002888 [Neoarthrinium moseri]|uniref:Ecp2 effector protein-like domain-containing protein n=2 Tax=Neoarthrinium moseri TaxID=1658444 RepID=A0A9Q0ASR2_9PEZI|nr:hypothetical protein JX265_002888 [Neoarthrinium moseri]
MFRFTTLLTLFPVALAATCANTLPVTGMVCHDFTQSDGTMSAILVNHDRQVVDGMPWKSRNATAQDSTNPVPEPFDVNVCNDSTFVRNNPPNVPSVADCRGVMEWARSNKVAWLLDKHDLASRVFLPLVTSGQCVFAAGSDGGGIPEYGIYFGNQDIADLVEFSIRDHTVNNGVATSGCMKCQTMSTNLGIDWTPACWTMQNV